ncbi:MAG TPA: hypothetical protein VL463_00080 [Kofleriaceae bacterium]|nr:hypothetical protein [Kofleriaceae bacterium]
MRDDLRDPELELEAAKDQVEVLEQEEPALITAERSEVETSELRFAEIAQFIEALLDKLPTELDQRLDLGDLEKQGLALIREAIQGHLLAEHRLAMLNDALAILQPTLAIGFESDSADMHNMYSELLDDVTALQAQLVSLTDAQEELLLQDMHADREATKPTDQGEVGDDRPSTLAGPGPAVEKPSPPTTLVGPGPAVEKPSPPTTLAGPGPAVEKPSPKSTVYEPEK